MHLEITIFKRAFVFLIFEEEKKMQNSLANFKEWQHRKGFLLEKCTLGIYNKYTSFGMLINIIMFASMAKMDKIIPTKQFTMGRSFYKRTWEDYFPITL